MEPERKHAVDLVDAHVAHWPDAPRLVYSERRWTALELAQRASAMAGALRELGVRRDDRVCVILDNGIEVLLAFEGIWRAGAAITPLMPSLTGAEIGDVLDRVRPSVVVTDDAARLADLELRCPLVTIEPSARSVSFEDLCASEAAAPDIERDPEALAAVLFTGGTTGRSKGVMLTHAGLSANAAAALTASDYGDDDVNLISLPLSHAFGLNVLLCSYLTGAALVILRRFDVELFLDAVATEDVTVTDAVPTMAQRLYEDERVTREALSSLRAMSVGGAPCPVSLIESFPPRLGVPLLDSYGLTEAGIAVALTPPWETPRPGSVGPPLPGVEVRILGSDAEPVTAGETGEVTVRSPSVMRGYWEDPDTTAATLVDGWLRTGDLGRLDADGWLSIVGRAKELIIRAGFNVYPVDLEAAIRKCDGVDDVTVVGVPDEDLGDRVVAFYVGTALEEAVQAHCREHIAAHKRPDDVLRVQELARTPVGKPDRRVLAEQALELIGNRR